MAKFEVSTQGDLTVMNIDGTVEESVDFEAALPKAPAKLDIHCGKVIRINSTGIKKWILFFTELQKKKTELTFYEVSPPLVEQFNAISNFGANGKIVSLCLPYMCESCNHSFLVVKTAEELKAGGYKIPPASCPKCQTPNAEFDDLEDEYLKFLTR